MPRAFCRYDSGTNAIAAFSIRIGSWYTSTIVKLLLSGFGGIDACGYATCTSSPGRLYRCTTPSSLRTLSSLSASTMPGCCSAAGSKSVPCSSSGAAALKGSVDRCSAARHLRRNLRRARTSRRCRLSCSAFARR